MLSNLKVGDWIVIKNTKKNKVIEITKIIRDTVGGANIEGINIHSKRRTPYPIFTRLDNVVKKIPKGNLELVKTLYA